MKKSNPIFSSIALLAGLSACSSNDMPVQHSDQYDNITFTVETQKVATRAAPRADGSIRISGKFPNFGSYLTR